MVKNKNEELVARLEYYLEELKTSCGDRKDLKNGHINHKTYAQIFQDIEEDEEMRDVLNVNIVFYKDMNYKWQYEIRKMYFDENDMAFCHRIVEEVPHPVFGWAPVYREKTTFGYGERNVFDTFYETKLDAHKACAKRISYMIEVYIERLTE
jgi:hypothetical protein